MPNLQNASLPQLPAAVTIEASAGIFGAPCIRVGIKPQLATREELKEHRELIYWLTSTALMREQKHLGDDFQRDHSTLHRFRDGHLVDLGISLIAAVVGDCEVSLQIDVPGVSTAHFRSVFDRVFANMLDQVDAVRPYAEGTE